MDLTQVNKQCMQIVLDTLAARHADGHIVMVMDGAGWHSSKKTCCSIQHSVARAATYSPELNPVEHLWNELREKCFQSRSSHASMPLKAIWRWVCWQRNTHQR
ncbi:MAG: transposase [Chitinophagaceae bacterium]|nr:transposase [Polaromonas sp.]